VQWQSILDLEMKRGGVSSRPLKLRIDLPVLIGIGPIELSLEEGAIKDDVWYAGSVTLALRCLELK